MCEYIIDLDGYVKNIDNKKLFLGKAWSDNCKDCIIGLNPNNKTLKKLIG